MDDLPRPSHRARRALPLIASALTAIVVVSLLYLTSGIRSSQSPASSAPIAVMSGPYLARYDFISPLVAWGPGSHVLNFRWRCYVEAAALGFARICLRGLWGGT